MTLSPRSMSVLAAAALFLAVFLAYAPARHADFVNFDDDDYITNNQMVQKGLTLDGVKWAFSLEGRTYWHPLTWMSLMADVSLFGVKPGPMHTQNILLHGLSAVLLYLFLFWATSRFWPSLAASLLFALHPLHVESVAWITERKDVLSVFFWMLTLIAYAWYSRKRTPGRYGLVALSMALGLMAKPLLITLPFVLALLDFWPLNSQAPLRARILEKIPLLALSAASVSLSVLSHAGTFGGFPSWLMIQNAAVSTVKYLLKAAWPFSLTPFYPFPEAVPLWSFLACLALLLGLSALALRAFFRGRPLVGVGWFWFLITLAPTMRIHSFGLSYELADRFAYVPLVGVYCILAFGLASALEGRSRPEKRNLLLAAGVVLGVLGFLTWRQAGVWKDSVTLWSHTRAVAPENYLAHYNLAVAYLAQGRADLAEEPAREAVRLKPRYPAARIRLARVLEARGRPEEALDELDGLLAMHPANAEAHFNRGMVLAGLKRTREAIAAMEASAGLDPAASQTHFNLGVLRGESGDHAGALAAFRAADAAMPDSAMVHYQIGVSLLRLDRKAEALAALDKALGVRPDFPEARKLRTQLALLLGPGN